MKSIILSICFMLSTQFLQGQNLYFPPTTGDNWDSTSFSELGWCTNQLPALYDYLDQSNTKAFIVLKDGKIAIEKYFDTFTKDSLWYWASAGKTITSFLVGKAQEEGYLNIDDTTSTYLGNGWTSLTSGQEEKITIKHQLSMTSGLDDAVADVHCTTPACLVYKADAGTRWAYHNGPYTLLQDVVAAATGTSFNAYLNPKLKQPTGMDGIFVPIGYTSVYFSKPRSMARFGLLMLNNGNWDGTQVMNDVNYLNDMITPSQTLNESYGYLWWLNGQPSFMMPSLQVIFPGNLMPNAPTDVYAAMGKNGQVLNVSPSNNLIVVRMGDTPDNSFVPNYYNDTIWQLLNPVMCGINSVASSSALDLKIYPNPSQGELYIKGLTKKATLTLYNLNGQLIWKKFLNGSNTAIQIPTHINRGIYLLRIQSESAIYSEKLVLN